MSFLVPEYVNGAPTFVPYAHDIQRLLKEGDPSIGWEGDDRLYIAPRDGAEGYVVGRLCEDGVKRLICFSKAPHRLDKELLIQMRDNDTRRNDVLKRVNEHNARLQKDIDDKAADHIGEAMDRVVHGLNKDFGYHY
jgi:hypothetical protein